MTPEITFLFCCLMIFVALMIVAIFCYLVVVEPFIKEKHGKGKTQRKH